MSHLTKLMQAVFPGALALALGACSGGNDSASDDVDDLASYVALSTISIDTTLRSPYTELPAFADGVPRVISTVRDANGSTASFVENEVWLATGEAQVLTNFLERWQGQILATFDTVKYDLPGLENQYLIRVNTSDVDVSQLVAHLKTLQPTTRSDLLVSSQDAMATLAISAETATAGLLSGINWVGQGADFVSRDIEDAPTGPSTYEPNAFSWPSHRLDDSQNIGVAEAWRAMDMAGLLIPNKVGLAILDMGFSPNSDVADGWIAVSNIPFVEPTGSENLIGCGNGNDCPWHGTQVVSAAMAVPDNSFGSAGPAGPIARPIMVHTLYDFFTSITALGEARINGARIANMSYSAPVPVNFGWSVLPFETVTEFLRANGIMLIFAAAGNDGINVDDTLCIPVPFLPDICFEHTWHTPCENNGVICVGGLAQGSRSRASDSNYGAEHVDIFAPYTQWLGPDPVNTGNITREATGTSYSSPFAAGIAALIQSTDAGLRVHEVEHILFESAHGSSDSKVNRTVNAFGAIEMAVGNIPPIVNLTSPGNGSTRSLNIPVNFQANTEDFEDGLNCCVVSWISSIDGDLGQGDTIIHTFTSTGQRVITASAQDSDGRKTDAKITLTIINNSPSVDITQPTTGENIFRGVATVLRGTSFDANEPGTQLDCNDMQWLSSNSADNLSAGCAISATFNSNGTRTITLVGTDSEGITAVDSVTINVIDPPQDLPPVVQITSLIDGSNINVSESQLLNATVSDDNDAISDLNMTWSVVWSNAGAGSSDIGFGQTRNWTPADTIIFNAEGIWILDVTLTVADSGGNEGSDTVRVQTILID